MQKKETQYLKGLSEVSAGYQAIVNSQVTDHANVQQKQQYIKTASDGLKKISATDLSLPTNSTQAQNLYAPFWQDDLLVQDIAFTKYSNGELSKLNNWKMSTDKDVRAMYNNTAETWIKQGLEDFSKAGRNPDVYRKLQKREAVPFYDINADIDAAYKAEEQKGVENVNIYGNKMVTEKNGPRSREAFKAWYLSKIGDKYDRQLYITESVRMHRAKQEILQQNPGLDEKGLNEHFAAEQMDKLANSYSGNIETYNKVSQQYTRQYNELRSKAERLGNKISVEDKANMDYYQAQAKMYKDQADQYQATYNKYGAGDRNNPNYQKTFIDLAEHPEDYLTAIEKSIMADNWAYGMSVMNTGTKIEVDPSWKAYMEEADKAADRVLRQREIDNTARGQTLGLFEKTGMTYPGGPQDPRYNLPGYEGFIRKDKEGNGKGVTGIPDPQSGSYIGPQTIDPAKLELTVDKVQATQEGIMSRITGSIYDPEGLSAAFGVDGLDNGTIINFTSWAKSGTSPTPDQEESINRVKDVLRGRGIPVDNIKGPRGMEAAVIEYSHMAAKDLLNSGDSRKIRQGKSIVNAYLNIEQQRNIALSNKQEYDNAVHEEMAQKPKYQKVYNKETGTVYSASDIASDIPININVNGKVLSPVEIATMRLDGQDILSIPNINSINGHPVKRFADKNGHVHTAYYNGQGADGYGGSLNNLSSYLNQKYGTAEQRQELLKQASKAVMPKLKFYDNGLIVQSQQFDPNIPGQENMAIGVSKEAVNPANTDISRAYVEGDKPGKNQELITATRNLIGSEDDLKKYTNGVHLTTTPDGSRALAYTFKSVIPKTTLIEGIEGDQFEGKTVVLPVNPGTTTPYINSLPWNDGNYLNKNMLYERKTITSPPVLEASGMKYMITPYNPVNGKNTKCSIEILKAYPDPVEQGKVNWVPVAKEYTNMLQGVNAKTPDEIMYMANSLVAQHIDDKISQAQTKEQNTAAGTPVQTR